MAGRREFEFEFDQRRFKDLLLYVAEKLADDPTAGSTKINKVLFFSDFEAFRLLGAPITGADYQKNLYGPTARLYTVMRDDLIRINQLKSERRVVVDHVQDVLRPHNIVPDTDQFSKEQMAIVDQVIDVMRRLNNTEVSDKSHEQAAGWRALPLGKSIPWNSAIIDPSPLEPSQLKKLRELIGLAA